MFWYFWVCVFSNWKKRKTFVYPLTTFDLSNVNSLLESNNAFSHVHDEFLEKPSCKIVKTFNQGMRNSVLSTLLTSTILQNCNYCYYPSYWNLFSIAEIKDIQRGGIRAGRKGKGEREKEKGGGGRGREAGREGWTEVGK